MPEVGPSFRDATRVAGSNPAIWGDIFSTNREAVAEAIDAAGERLSEAAELIRRGNRDAVVSWHAAAGGDRRGLLEAELGEGPLHELRVVVANRPGTVAELALALGEAGVNIEDMALYPAPDMNSGAVSLWVSGAEGAGRAAALVRELGRTVTRRPQRLMARFDPSGPLGGTPPARRQVDLPPGGADCRNGGGRDRDRGLPRRRRYPLDSCRCGGARSHGGGCWGGGDGARN